MLACCPRSQAVALDVGTNIAVDITKERPGVQAANVGVGLMNYGDSGSVDAKN